MGLIVKEGYPLIGACLVVTALVRLLSIMVVRNYTICTGIILLLIFSEILIAVFLMIQWC